MISLVISKSFALHIEKIKNFYKDNIKIQISKKRENYKLLRFIKI